MPWGITTRGVVFSSAADYKGAMAEYEATIRLKSDNAEAYNNLGRLLMRKII